MKRSKKNREAGSETTRVNNIDRHIGNRENKVKSKGMKQRGRAFMEEDGRLTAEEDVF